ncbi:MAG TPA: hypothetical protein VMG08_13045 [Allosphingosinicella sp.]|nr:hypothetical protein [Allosphingosinicella sp.]
MDERDEPVRHETTIINTGERGGGGGATMLALVIALLVGIGAFLYFGGYLGGGDRDININIKAPDINLDTGGGNSAR